MAAKSCQGCGETATDFQCPLCQAEGHAMQGFYCSQECFAKKWAAHRSQFHKSGVVREKRRVAFDDDSNGTSAKKRSRMDESEKGKPSRGATKRAAAVSESDDDSRASETASITEASAPLLYVPWPLMPSYSPRVALTEPALPLDCPRAVVDAAAGDDAFDSFWPHAAAAAHYVAQLLSKHTNARVLLVVGSARTAHAAAWAVRCTGLASRLRLVLNPSQTAMALGEASPTSLFSAEQPIVIATRDVVVSVGGAAASEGSGAAALWLPDDATAAMAPSSSSSSVLLTLPDVENAADLQGVRTRAVFFVSRDTPASAWSAEESVTHVVVAGSRLEELLPMGSDFALYGTALSWQPMPSTSDILEDEDTSGDDEEEDKEKDVRPGRACHEHAKKRLAEDTDDNEDDAEIVMVSRQQCISGAIDNALATSLARGDTPSAVQHLVRVYRTESGHYEEYLFNALCCDWGAVSVAHAHHRLAHIVRRLVDASTQFKAPKGATLADATLRAATRVVRLLPPLIADPEKIAVDVEAEKVPEPLQKERLVYFNYFNSSIPNIQLQATLCYLFDVAPAATLDTFATAWGVSHYLEGPAALKVASQSASRVPMVKRVTSRYTPKLSAADAAFLVVLGHLLYDTVAIYSLSEEEVDARTLWRLTLANDAGPLHTFLGDCFLLHPSANAASKASASNQNALSSRQTKTAGTAAGVKAGSRLALLRGNPVRAVKPSDYIRLPWKPFPLTGMRARAIAHLHRAAVEEVLMAMPRVPKPMYIGDVGLLIGRWFHFNARFDGVLGVTLSDFLSRHPEEFQLAGRLVTRRKAGKTEQVRVRFDNDGGGSDDDDDDGTSGRKARDRALLTGSKAAHKKAAEARERELPSRTRKKRAVKAFNKERFNRNYKSIDASARVPGFVKRGPRRITGRGKKPNKRLVKRG